MPDKREHYGDIYHKNGEEGGQSLESGSVNRQEPLRADAQGETGKYLINWTKKIKI